MIHFYEENRAVMAEIIRSSLPDIRKVLGLGVQDLGDLIGVTRQTINNLETGKNKMSPTQCIAICAVIDTCIRNNPEKMEDVFEVLKRKDKNTKENGIFEKIEMNSLLRKWFNNFPDKAEILGFPEIKSDISRKYKLIAENYRIFIDDTALCCETFIEATARLAEEMRNKGNMFIVPKIVEDDIKDSILSGGEKAEMAIKGLRAMQRFKDLIQYAKNPKTENDTEEVTKTDILKIIFKNYKRVNRMALITSDMETVQLMLDINITDKNGFDILVLYCDKENGLGECKTED